jgi:hypothetical protein
MKLFLPVILLFTVLVSKASAAEDIDTRATLDVSRLKGARVRYYPFDLEQPTKASVSLPSLVFRGDRNLIEKCRLFILERLVYPVLSSTSVSHLDPWSIGSIGFPEESTKDALSLKTAEQ